MWKIFRIFKHFINNKSIKQNKIQIDICYVLAFIQFFSLLHLSQMNKISIKLSSIFIYNLQKIKIQSNPFWVLRTIFTIYFEQNDRQYIYYTLNCTLLTTESWIIDLILSSYAIVLEFYFIIQCSDHLVFAFLQYDKWSRVTIWQYFVDFIFKEIK
jgi:hypothetical protein